METREGQFIPMQQSGNIVPPYPTNGGGAGGAVGSVGHLAAGLRDFIGGTGDFADGNIISGNLLNSVGGNGFGAQDAGSMTGSFGNVPANQRSSVGGFGFGGQSSGSMAGNLENAAANYRSTVGGLGYGGGPVGGMARGLQNVAGDVGLVNGHVGRLQTPGSIHLDGGHFGDIQNIGCPGGFLRLGSNCYAHVNSTKSWSDAQSTCQLYGGFIAEPRTLEENIYLKGIVYHSGVRDIWLGASDMIKEGYWHWSTGGPFHYTDWGNKQPNNAGNDQDCLMLHGTHWNDVNCKRMNRFICQAQGNTGGVY